MYIGMSNYEDYDEKWCSGHYCPRDCEICECRAENREDDEPEDYPPDDPERFEEPSQDQLEMGFNPYMGGYDFDC